MQIHCLTHVDYEGPGCLSRWANSRRHSLIEVQPARGDRLPDASAVEGLLVFGGPQSPLNTKQTPYLADEISWLDKLLQLDKPIVGFCLGAQLIAEALGATTRPSPEKEMGNFPVELTPEGRLDPLLRNGPGQFDAFHWHYDMPGLPKQSVWLARSAGCPHQAFRVGQNVYGFQFHFEMTQESARTLIANAEHDLVPSRYTQSKETILRADFSKMNQQIEDFLDSLFRCSVQVPRSHPCTA